METTWYVAANAGRARFFAETDKANRLEEVDDMVNPAVRLRVAEKEPDKLGPTAAGKSIHNVGNPTPNKAYEPNQTPDEHETDVFARSVADALLQAHQQGRFKHLGLIASPQFLGILRKLLDAQLQPLVSLDINKDYTQLGAQQLQEQIRAHQQKPPA